MIRLHICCAYLNAHCQVVVEGLRSSCQMFIFVLWSIWNKKLGQLVIDIYWLWMFWRCLIPIHDGDIGNSLLWVLLVWHFYKRPSSFMFCNFMFFSMKSLKLTKTFMGGCTVTSFCIYFEFVRDIFSMYPLLSFTCPSLGYKFLVIMIFIPL